MNPTATKATGCNVANAALQSLPNTQRVLYAALRSLPNTHRALFVAGRREDASVQEEQGDEGPTFPSAFFPVEWEEAQLAQWQREGTFALSVEANKQPNEEDPKPRYFSFQEGPPTANGRPGLHHVLARTFKDLVCRWKTMQGYVVERKAGWDCHGLPVEREVEKMLGFSTYEQVQTFGLERFNQLCRESVWKYQTEWEKLSERMGYWTDVSNRYATLDVEYMESEWWAMKKLWQKGLLRKGYKVLPYSPQSGTTYSNRDVAEGYKVVTDLSCFVRFPLVSFLPEWETEGCTVSGFRVSMMVWTSTPWTLPGNALLAVHKDFTYALVKVVAKISETAKEDTHACFKAETNYFKACEVFCVAQDLVDELQNKFLSSSSEAYSFEVVRTMAGKDLLGLSYSPPFRECDQSNDPLLWRVVHADFVNNQTGTGVVHVAPMYGEDDHNLCTTLNLDLNRPECQHVVGLDGRFMEDYRRVPQGLHGLDVTSGQTQEKVSALLHQLEILYRAEPVTHQYPHCWRNKSHRLLYYAKEAWFVTMADQAVRSRMQNLNSTQVQFSPENVRDGRFGGWLEQSRDWCVSRSRSWGCPLPVWVCRKENGGCGRELCVGSRAELRSLEALKSSDRDKEPLLDDLHTTRVDSLHLQCDLCQKEGTMQREQYGLDCWFDSGCAPFAQWHYPFAFSSMDTKGVPSQYNGSAEHPVDFVAEGQDQCRGWFYSMHALSTVLFDRPAFKKCLVVGLVLDDKGAKMSKSLGNSVDPWKHFRDEGADALRWYLLGMSAPWMERRFEEQKVRLANQKFFCVLFNVSKWWHTQWKKVSASHDVLPVKNPNHRRVGNLDRWILSRLACLVKECNQFFEKDQFHLAVNALEAFVAEDLSKTYLRLSRAHFCNDPRANVVVDASSVSMETAASLSVTRMSCLSTMRTVLLYVCRLVAPMAPFFVDTLHRSLMKALNCNLDSHHSVHMAPWPMFNEVAKWLDTEVEQQMCWLQTLLDAARVLHEKGCRPGRLPMVQAYVTAPTNAAVPSVKDGTMRFSEELALVLAYELNVRQVTVLSHTGFENMLSNAQAPTLRPNMSQLGSRFRKNANEVMEALETKFGSGLLFHVNEPPMAESSCPASHSKSSGNNRDVDRSSLGKTSKKQLKREQNARKAKARKEGAGSATLSAAWKGPHAEEALRLLQTKDSVLEVTSSKNATFGLRLGDFDVSFVPRDGFAVSVAGLVLDLSVTPELVSLYLAKELTHFVHQRRKKLEQKRLKEGKGPLGLVDLHVVLMNKDATTAGASPGTDDKPVVLSANDWSRVLEATWADPSSAVLYQKSPESQEKLRQCQKDVELGLMESFEVRAYRTCGGFKVFVQCSAANGAS